VEAAVFSRIIQVRVVDIVVTQEQREGSDPDPLYSLDAVLFTFGGLLVWLLSIGHLTYVGQHYIYT